MKVKQIRTSVSLHDGYDVIVAGGGPSGCAAAVAAARDGARTLLLEGAGALGGMGTSGLVPAWCPFSDKHKIIYRGLAERVFTASKAATPHVDPQALDWVPIDPESLKRIYDDLVTRAGVEVLFHTSVCGVEAAGGRVDTVLAANKGGLSAFRGKVFVDATGDGDLCAWAGAPFEKGDEKGELQPVTHCFLLSNVDEYGYARAGWHVQEDTRRMADQKKYPLLTDVHICKALQGPGTVGFNAGHQWEVDNTDPASTSRALVEGRRIADEFRRALAEYWPAAFGNAHLAATGALLGVRETRRILGDYLLTIDDFLARRTFPDEIARNSYPVDIHTARNEIADALDYKIVAMGRFEHYGKGESHGIPYRCLTPKGLSNVLVTGRCISTDRNVQASTRVMPVCLVTGEAAGAAAAQAATVATPDIHALDVPALRATLLRHGAWFL